MTDSRRTARRGRPAKPEGAMLKPVMVRFPADMLEQIDDIAAERLDKPERSSVIRELIAKALSDRPRKTAKGR